MPEECRSRSGKRPAEDQYQQQDQHQHQDQNDDDGEAILSEDVGMDDLRAIALELSRSVKGWAGTKRFVKELDQDKLLALVSWLWLYVGLNSGDLHTRNAALGRYAKGNPFQGVSNPVGKMIAQVRLGNMAPLHEDDRRELLEYFQEVRSGVNEDIVEVEIA